MCGCAGAYVWLWMVVLWMTGVETLCMCVSPSSEHRYLTCADALQLHVCNGAVGAARVRRARPATVFVCSPRLHTRLRLACHPETPAAANAARSHKGA